MDQVELKLHLKHAADLHILLIVARQYTAYLQMKNTINTLVINKTNKD